MRPKPTLADQAPEIRKKAAALGVRVRFDLEPDESTTRLTLVKTFVKRSFGKPKRAPSG